ncbi:hypothetical protein ACFWYJ_30500, partial [Streptomyces albireticuli]
MGERRRVVAWCGRLLLFAALLLGIVTMHTLGHPTSDHGAGSGAGGGTHGAAAAEAGQAGAGGGPRPAAGRPGDHAGTCRAGCGGGPERAVGGAAS